MAPKQPIELVEPERISDGFSLTVSNQEKNTHIFLFLFGLVWTGTSAFLFVNVLKDAIRVSDRFSLFNIIEYFAVAFVGMFVLIGLVILGLSVLETWANAKLHPAELVLPKYPLRLGETCPIYFRRRLRNGTFTKAGQVEAKLVCDEWVQYTQGTDTVTKTHSLHEQPLPDCTIISGEHSADYDADITLPREHPSSFYGRYNKVRWRLVVKLRVPGIPQACQSTFHLKVVPETIAS